MSLAELKGDIVILACAVSAGIHAALVPTHFDEGTGAGVAFVLAAIALASVAVWSTLRPASSAASASAVAVLAGLLAAYAAAITVGIPILHPDPEPVDGLAVATKAIEAVGLFAAADLVRIRAARPIPLGLTTLVALFSALVALALTNGHAHSAL